MESTPLGKQCSFKARITKLCTYVDLPKIYPGAKFGGNSSMYIMTMNFLTMIFLILHMSLALLRN